VKCSPTSQKVRENEGKKDMDDVKEQELTSGVII